MIRVGLLLLLGSMVMGSTTNSVDADHAKKANDDFVIAISRQQGNARPVSPTVHYEFTVAKDGSWKFTPVEGKAKQGKLNADDLNKWLQEIANGGFGKLISNPKLGQADEPYMDITIQAKGKTERKRVRLLEKLAQAIEKKIIEIASPDK